MSAIRRLRRRTRRSELRHRETLLLEDAQGTIIVVERGCLWITLEDDPRDVVLCQGMRFAIDRPGRTIVAAEADSTLRLLAPPRLRDRLATSLARAGAALFNGLAGRLSTRVLRYF